MKHKVQFIYDGSFEGFLTCVFVSFEEKVEICALEKEETATPDLFAQREIISTDLSKAKRVWRAYKSKTNCLKPQQLFNAFLSEIKGIELKLLLYLEHIFNNTEKGQDYSDKIVLTLSQVSKMVAREKHRMEAFVRFELLEDELYFAKITPDFDVLPLIHKHFEGRYADQKWVIYDLKRNYGIHYDLNQIQFMTFESKNTLKKILNFNTYCAEEKAWQNLWSTYFCSVNIKSRKNSKLHKQHIPTRYWKYLTEKVVL